MRRAVLAGLLAAGALTWLADGLRAGERATPAAKRGLMQAVIVEKGPEIDGTLKSPVWQACPPLALGECTSDKPGPLATTARVLFDATRLYVSFDCAEPDTAGLKQDVAERDGKVWEDDCVEVFVTGDLREGYCHFTINPRGAFFDAVTRGSKRDDASWTSSAVVKASVVPNERWVVTLAVPLKELAAYVGENQTWVMNLNRTRPARGSMPEAEWSWAIMGSNDYHQVLDYGRIEGVRISRREDGVTRQAPPAPPPPLYERGREVGGVIVYRRFDEMTVPEERDGLNKSIGLLIRGSEGLKVAFLARGKGGVGTAQFNLYDERSRDNTTSDAYRWVDGQWRPVLYRCDRFVYNEGMNRMVARATSYRDLRFHGAKTPEGKGLLELRHVAIYRGEDTSPPTAPAGLAARSADAGVSLSWKDAADNVGVALYIVSRAGDDGKFVKVGQSCEPAFVDKPAVAGKYSYRVLAADFQGNLGPWSEPVRVEVARAFDLPATSVEERDRPGYAEKVRAIAAAGAGKVVRGRVLCFGDSITGATNYRRYVESALRLYDVWARGYEGQRTDFGRRKIDQDLKEVRPEFCLIMLGTNNSKAAKDIPAAMDDLAAIAKSCEAFGTVPVIATISPRGFNDPKSAPEAGYNEAVVKMCREGRIPAACVFEAFQDGGDRRKLLAPDGVHLVDGGWEVAAKAWQAAMAQVEFALLDRP
jgi:lysophospholipase L1-like esterase